MSGKHFRRAAGLVVVSAATALVASAAYPAGAAAPGGQQQSAVAAKRSSRTLLPARSSWVALDPSIAAVRGTDGGVWATTGSGFADLGGKVLGGPAVAADPTREHGVFFLAQGINGDLYLRTDSPDFPWR